jgi:hypothetical protein
MSAIIKTGYVVDGNVFQTKAEAQSFLRRPMKERVLMALTGNNQELVNWLLDNEEGIAAAYEVNKIRRVRKSEHNALKKALENVAKTGDRQFGFLIDNLEAVLNSFRWPSVKRGTEEEQAANLKSQFMALTGDNPELCDWLISSQEHILAGFDAGIEKRTVPESAKAGLAAYQARKAAEKAAAEAAAAAAEATK